MTASLALLASVALLAPAAAEARGRPFVHRGLVGFYTPVLPYYGFYGPGAYFYGPGAYFYGYPYFRLAREGGIDPNYARIMGWGAIDLNVKPKKAEVWVDGRLIGKVQDFDGYPSYLWLEEGTHRVVLSLGGYRTYDETITIEPGAVVKLKLKLLPGESDPPKVG